jgi:cytochrome c oxidase assembly protein subunit 15
VVGYVQYFTGLPEALVTAHMLGASLLVVALTNGVLALRSRDEPRPDDAVVASTDTVRAA